MLKKSVVKRKIFFLIVLISIVFVVFEFFALLMPSIFQFSSKSAIFAAKLSLPESKLLLSELNFNSNSALEGTSKKADDVFDVEFDGNEASLFKSKEAASVVDFEPPFLIGPPRVIFSQTEIQQKNKGKDGPILRNCYKANGSSGKIVELAKTAHVKNLTKLPNSVVEKANKTKPSFVFDEKSAPQVLILHTHATEAYELKEQNFYSNQVPSHSKNVKESVIGVGDEIASQLEAAGVGVIHDKTMHDDPSYNGAYDRSNQTIRNYLAKHPSIKVVLDVHRDGIQNEKAERIAPVVKINGRKAAQIMIISGCDNGSMHYPSYEKNLAFACFLQRNLEADYPNLTRPLLFKYKHYNQSLTPGSLLVEIGSNSNSVDEARFAGWLFGKSLAKSLKKLKK